MERQKAPGTMVLVDHALLNTVCHGYVQEQAHAVNTLRALLPSLLAAAEPAPTVGGVPIQWADLGLPLAVLKEAFTAHDSAERVANMDVAGTVANAFEAYQRVRGHVYRLLSESGVLQSRLNASESRNDELAIQLACRADDMAAVSNEFDVLAGLLRCALPFVQARCVETDYGDASARTTLDGIHSALKRLYPPAPAADLAGAKS